MASSDSCVSGSDDVRTPPIGKGSGAASEPAGGEQQPNRLPTESSENRAGAKPQPEPRRQASGADGGVSPRGDAEKAALPSAPNPTAKPVSKPAVAAQPATAVGPAPNGRDAPPPPAAATAQPTTAQPTTAQPTTATQAPLGLAANQVGTPPGDAGTPPSGELEPEESESEPSKLLTVLTANHFLLFNAVPSWMVSMVVHAGLLIVLALVTLPERSPERNIVAVANPHDVEDIENLEFETIDPVDVDVFEGPMPADVTDSRESITPSEMPSLDDVGAAPDQIQLDDFGDMASPSDDLLDQMGGGTEVGLGEARGAKARKGMVEKFGGSEGSEAAVAAALKWLALHQERDGGWDFDHTRGPCKGQCPNPGRIISSRNGATAMALLPFLGAGQTHKEGEYKETVGRGLAFLVRQMKLGNAMGDLSDVGGKLYSHGLAAITLCEAYAMTTDVELMQPAQLALNFIVYAQDPVGGGWRYVPQQAGDTSVLGWQLMACKSGHMGYLRVPRKTFVGASRFLDFVQEQNGALYGYTVPGGGPATTAVGLLSRMYLGWNHESPALKAGVEYLHQWGPTDDMYYNYYATQVMRHYGDPYWTAWNTRMRDRLVTSQDQKGHAKGSWYFPNTAHGDQGARLYCTSMATMILEVYYRHLPIYGKQAAEEDFPL